jgi:chromosome segregation ATPase
MNFPVLKLVRYIISEATVDEQKQQIIELEDELQTAEDGRLRCEVNIGALKQQMEKHAHESNEQIEERMRSLNKQIKEYEIELDEERKAKQQTLQQRKKLEIDLQDSRQQIEEANKQKEEALRNSRRLQVTTISFFSIFLNFSSRLKFVK